MSGDVPPTKMNHFSTTNSIFDTPEAQTHQKWTFSLNQLDWTSKVVFKTPAIFKIMPSRHRPFGGCRSQCPRTSPPIYIYRCICIYIYIYIYIAKTHRAPLYRPPLWFPDHQGPRDVPIRAQGMGPKGGGSVRTQGEGSLGPKAITML